MGKTLIIMGVMIALIGVAVYFWGRIPFIGKLPGDITVERGNFVFHFPLVTGIVLSAVATLVVNVIIRLFR